MAGNTLGSFSYDMLLNYALFEQGLKNAERTAKESANKIAGALEGGIERIGEGFKEVATILGVGFSIDKLIEVGKVSLEAAEQVDSLSRALGVTTKTLQTMQYVAALGGGNLEQVSTSLERLERSGEQAASGNLQVAEAFHTLGIETKDLGELLKDPDKLMTEVAKHVAGMGDGTAKTAAIMQIFGRNSAAIIPFLDKLGGNFEALQKQAEEFGVVLSGQDQAALTAAQEGLNELGQAARGAGNQFTLAMLPAIEAVTDAIKEFFENGSSKSFFESLANNIDQAVTVLGQFKDNVALVGEVLSDIGVKGSPVFNDLKLDLVDSVRVILDDWAKVKATFKEGWVVMKADAALAWADIRNAVTGALKQIAVEFSDLLANLSKFALYTNNLDLSVAFQAMAKSVQQFGAGLAPVTADLEGYKNEIISIETAKNSEIASNQQWADSIHLTQAGIKDLKRGYDEFVGSLKKGDVAGNTKLLDQAISNLNVGAKQLIASGADQEKVYAQVAKTTDQLTQATIRADAAQGSYNAKVNDNSGPLKTYEKDLSRLTALENELASGLGGPYLAAFTKYQKGIQELRDTWRDANRAGEASSDLAHRLSGDYADLTEEYKRTTKQIKDQHDAMQTAINDATNLQKVTSVEPKYRADALAALTEYDRRMKEHYDFYGNYIQDEGDLKAQLDQQLPTYEKLLKHITDINEAQKLSDEATKEWVDIWVHAGESLGDTFSKILVEGGSLFDSLKDLAKQTVEAIISYFAKLAVINPILNAIFGGSAGFSTLPSFANAAGFLGGAGGAAAEGTGAFDWVMGASGTESGAATGGYTSWISAGQSLWTGFSKGLQGFYNSPGIGSSFLGNTTYGDFGNTFAPSGFTTGASIAGGVYAGYNRYQQAGGGLGGVAGGLAYGYGTYTAGIAGAALISGGASAALASIGPVGWVALGLMAIDTLSGGKLFGTKGKFNFGEQAITVGQGGATVSAGYDLKGQKPLFGGSTHSWQNLAVDPAAQAAADEFFAALLRNTDEFAKQFNAKAGDVIGGQFIATFDKHGNVTKTSSTVLGKTYNEDQQAFQQRLVDENDLAVLMQFDKELNSSVDKYRANIEDLTAVTQGLAAGQLMIQNGTKFLALGADQSLSALLKLAEGTQRFGESIGDALGRIEQAQAQYDQFVGQFKKVTFVDDYEQTLSNINAQMEANIKTANDLAIAAGAQGASEEDLANIHKYAADQATQALYALEASAQSLAFQMGLTAIGPLDQVTAEIQRLQAKAGQGSGSVTSFGNAIQSAAQKAHDAMQLLIGDLSPLNDQQKLQSALGGLKKGTVTQEEVLQIGRRLYATSQQYTDLFNMVKAIGDHSGAAAGAGGGGRGGGGGLTGAEQQRLSDLLEEQQKLQAAQDYQNAQILTQQIADIAQTRGIDFHQVIDEMGINLADLEKRLNLSDDQFAALIKSDQDKKDSAGQNANSIIQAINDMSDAIVTALGGTPEGHSHHDTNPGGTSTPPPRTVNIDTNPIGHSGHGWARTVGQEIGRAVAATLGGSTRRSSRE